MRLGVDFMDIRTILSKQKLMNSTVKVKTLGPPQMLQADQQQIISTFHQMPATQQIILWATAARWRPINHLHNKNWMACQSYKKNPLCRRKQQRKDWGITLTSWRGALPHTSSHLSYSLAFNKTTLHSRRTSCFAIWWGNTLWRRGRMSRICCLRHLVLFSFLRAGRASWSRHKWLQSHVTLIHILPCEWG